MNKVFLSLGLIIAFNALHCGESSASNILRAALISGKRGGLIALGLTVPTMLANSDSIIDKVGFPIFSGFIGGGVSALAGGISAACPVTITQDATEKFIRSSRSKMVGTSVGTVCGMTTLALFFVGHTFANFKK